MGYIIFQKRQRSAKKFQTNPMENLVCHSCRQLWLVLGVNLMEINSNLFSRPSKKKLLKHVPMAWLRASSRKGLAGNQRITLTKSTCTTWGHPAHGSRFVQASGFGKAPPRRTRAYTRRELLKLAASAAVRIRLRTRRLKVHFSWMSWDFSGRPFFWPTNWR